MKIFMIIFGTIGMIISVIFSTYQIYQNGKKDMLKKLFNDEIIDMKTYNHYKND